MINAKSEDIQSKPSFRVPFKKQRCLIPSNGFYEWKSDEIKGVSKDKGKIPYYIHFKDNRLFAFAGLFDVWKDPEGKEIYSFTILTTKPNKLIEKIHNRMPVILKREDEERWLSIETSEEELIKLLKPVESSEMEAYVVSNEVNNPRKQSPNLIEKLKKV